MQFIKTLKIYQKKNSLALCGKIVKFQHSLLVLYFLVPGLAGTFDVGTYDLGTSFGQIDTTLGSIFMNISGLET